MALSQQTQAVGCCKFLRWPSRRGYRVLTMEEEEEEEEEVEMVSYSSVRVVVGKEKRLFLVDPFVLQKEPFRLLMEMVRRMDVDSSNRGGGGDQAIFVDVDSILFEHMLWLVYNNNDSSSSMFHLNLREIIEFYSDQD